MKILILVIIIALAVLAIMPSYTAALGPHENPGNASEDFDGAALFREFAWALDYVSLRDLAGLKMLVDETTFANIPPDLEVTMRDFLSSSQDLAQLLSSLDIDLNHAIIRRILHGIRDVAEPKIFRRKDVDIVEDT